MPSDNKEGRCLSGKRDSNSRPSAWEANALPTELLPHAFSFSGTKVINKTRIVALALIFF